MCAIGEDNGLCVCGIWGVCVGQVGGQRDSSGGKGEIRTGYRHWKVQK